MGKIFINALFGLFALCGLAALLYSLWSVYMAHQSESWPRTSGTVLQAYCYSTSGGQTATWFRHVWYQYQVNGKSYKSDREHFGIRISSRDCKAGYSKGQAVIIFYNPSQPDEAVLLPGVYYSANLGVVFGLIFTGLSVLGSWLAGKKKRRQS